MSREADAERKLFAYGTCRTHKAYACRQCKALVKSEKLIDQQDAEIARQKKIIDAQNERLGLDDEDLMPRSVRMQNEDGRWVTLRRVGEGDNAYYALPDRSVAANRIRAFDKMVRRHVRENGM